MKLMDLNEEIVIFGKKYSPKQYLKLSFGISILTSIVLSSYYFDLIFLFPLIFYFFIFYAKNQYFQKLGKIEKDLPNFLEMIALMHKIGIPLNVILENLKYDYPHLINFDKIYEKYREKSVYVSQSYFLFNTLKNSGSGEEEILEFCEEMRKDMELKIKEYNKKLTMFATLFIGTSIMLPSLLQAYYVIGSKFMDIGLKSDQIFLIYCFLFPLINGGLLWYISQKKPRFY